MRAVLCAATVLIAMPALAFHSGGVGECEGCHTMHAKDMGQSPRPFLMAASDPSSTCLVCHSGMRPATGHVLSTNIGGPPDNYTPAGDYAWLLRSYSWNGAKSVATSAGERHGHSVVAADFNLPADSTNITAPGGTYPSTFLSCISCHDPHGRYRVRSDGTFASSGDPIVASGTYANNPALPNRNKAYGAYRLLAGRGYQPRALDGALSFGSDPPIAIAPMAYNRSEMTAEVRIAYGSGMSEWCANCHGNMHTSQVASAGSYRHPSGAQARLGRVANIYNAYLRSGDMGGSWMTAYTSLVPYEEGTADRSTLASHASDSGSYRIGPSGTENVMCLSCHRAHASGWDHAMRWNPDAEYVVASGQWPGIDAFGEGAKPVNAQGRTRAETRAAMYDREPSAYAAFQTTLCNKCHAK